MLTAHFSPRIALAAALSLAGTAAALAGTQTHVVRISVSSTGAEANGSSFNASMSGDGRYVAFQSTADNLAGHDTNLSWDVFLHDRLTGTTQRVSVSVTGDQGDASSFCPSLSRDGRWLVFTSEATNLVPKDTNAKADVFVRDNMTGAIERVSVNGKSLEANDQSHSSRLGAITADGRFVVFTSDASNLDAGDTNGLEDVFVRDRQLGLTRRVSVSSHGRQGDQHSNGATLCSQGGYVAFTSDATNLVGGDTNGRSDVFLHDLASGITERVSISGDGQQGNGASYDPVLCAAGRYVYFVSEARNLVGGDTNGASDAFLRDRLTGETQRVSVSKTGAQGSSFSFMPSISACGRFAAFTTEADNLFPNDTNGTLEDVVLHDRVSGATLLMSVSDTGVQGDGISEYAVPSDDSRYIAFESDATTLVAGDANGLRDVFVVDRGAARAGVFCASKTNSQACQPLMDADGVPSLSGKHTFIVSATNVINQRQGILFYGTAPLILPYHSGTMCVAQPLRRTGVRNSGGNPPPEDCSGSYAFDLNPYLSADPTIAVGNEVFCQFWYRDENLPSGTGMTDALQFVVQP